MKPCLVDVNVWIALAHEGHEHHTRAVTWFDELAEGDAFFCRITQIAFLRLLTNVRIAEYCGARPSSLTEAWGCYERFLADPRSGFLTEPNGMDDEFRRMSDGRFAATKLLADAYLAAFANAWSIGLATFDGGFGARGGVRDLVIIE